MSVSPAGFIEIRDGQARYRRIFDPLSYAPFAIGGLVALLLAFRSLRGRHRG